ncbi:MAG: hypothetical protein NZ774_00495 [Candidatus Poseidoniales archaeon]|nr:hypothetical protein [Candidatus Poseidoniales archaeon]
MAGNDATGGMKTLGVYDADDAADTATDDSNDTLMRIDWIEVGDDLDWNRVQPLRLSVGDNVYDCSIHGNQPCLIQQHGGDDDNLWEKNDILMISENGENIVGASGGEVEIHISYEGSKISGTDSIYVV